ncbi:hypothetical protein Acr_02g0010450 [Actinidia rufa]|uniref:Uncharacterized protein n=1 Tax=Actinidia rufa TaxID=165716 RepID=A0A7J0E8U6_9ERIC|nr:hypothetical protein Acr_02g0010450 [Actinidia rufa]
MFPCFKGLSIEPLFCLSLAALPAASAAPALACAAASSSHAIQPNTCAAPTQQSSTVQQFHSPAGSSYAPTLGPCASSSSPCTVQRISQLRSPAPKQPCAVCATIPHSGRQACVVQPSAQSSALRSHTSLFRGKRKTRWILEKEPKPTESDPTFDEWVADNCIILGWICMLMPAMSPGSLSSTEISPMPLNLPWDSWLQIILDISKLDGRNWPNTSPLVIFPVMGLLSPSVLIVDIHINFLMGLKPEFEALRTQIVNIPPLPSLYEAFAIVDGDEWRRRLLPSIFLPETSSTIPDQIAFVAPFGTHPYCQHCHKPGYLIDRCFVLHSELKSQFNRNRGGGRVGGRGGGRATPRVGAIAEIEPMHTEIPNLNQLQTQIAQLQSHLGLVPSSSSSGPMANIAAESPTALYGSSSFSGTASDLVMEEGSAHPRPLPILGSPPPSLSGSHAPVPLPASSPDSGISSPVVSDLPSPRYPTRVRRPPLGFFFPTALIILLQIICLTKVFQTPISLF